MKRRTFIRSALATGPFFLFPTRASAHQRTLKIAHWAHSAPGYDQWFDAVYVQEWGRRNDTRVIVDRVPIDSINARASAEIAARKGHDLFVFPWPPAVHQQHAIDHTEIYQAVGNRHGNVNRLGHRSTYNPRTKRYFAFADSWIPTPVHFFADYWDEANTPLGPSSYDTLRSGAKRIRAARGIPCGFTMANGLEGNITLHSLLWAFRTSAQDEAGNVSINSSHLTIEALKYARALYADAGAPEILAWGPLGNARAMLARKSSCTANAISLLRTAEKDDPDLARGLLLRPPLAGPGGVWAAPQVTSCCVVWNFAGNKEGAKQFLVDLIDNFKQVFEQSGYCNFPIYQNTVPDLIHRLSKDPHAGHGPKYEELKDALKWTWNLGYPGFATPEFMETFSTNVIPRMFASVVKGELTPEDAALAAENEMKRIYQKWRQV
jgi:multiple sugar transport system substrate-binding protein